MFPGRIKRETSPQLGWKTVKLLNPNFLQTTSNYYTSVYILQTFKLKLTSKLIWTCRCVLRNEYIFAVTNKSTNKIWEYLFKVNHQDTRLKINHKSYIGHLRDRLSYIDRSSSGFIVDFAICFDICYWKSINAFDFKCNLQIYHYIEARVSANLPLLTPTQGQLTNRTSFCSFCRKINFRHGLYF